MIILKKKVNKYTVLVMYAFLLLALPALLLRYCFTDKKFKAVQFLPPVLTGLFLGILLCMAREFFFVSSVITENNTVLYFFHDVLNFSVIPSAVVLFLYMLISKDRKEYKAASVFPVEASFYAILLPFTIITSDEKTSFFLNIILPVLTAATLLAQSAFVSLAAKEGAKKLTVIVLKLCAVFVPAVIPFIKQMWFFKFPVLIYIPLALIITGFELLFFAFSQKERDEL